jgi:hypothetical protein
LKGGQLRKTNDTTPRACCPNSAAPAVQSRFVAESIRGHAAGAGGPQRRTRARRPRCQNAVELQQGGDIRQVTLGQLATHTSGLLLPQDHPPWPDWGYTLSEFIHTLNGWKADKAPGQRHLYTHAGFVLLQLALERRYAMPIDELIDQRVRSRQCDRPPLSGPGGMLV